MSHMRGGGADGGEGGGEVGSREWRVSKTTTQGCGGVGTVRCGRMCSVGCVPIGTVVCSDIVVGEKTLLSFIADHPRDTLVRTGSPHFLCTALPNHWRANKSLPHPFYVLALGSDVLDGTTVTLTAGNDDHPGGGEGRRGEEGGTIKNGESTMAGGVARFSDLRFVGKSGRGKHFHVVITVATHPPQVTIYENAIKVTADGPRDPRHNAIVSSNNNGCRSVATLPAVPRIRAMKRCKTAEISSSSVTRTTTTITAATATRTAAAAQATTETRSKLAPVAGVTMTTSEQFANVFFPSTDMLTTGVTSLHLLSLSCSQGDEEGRSPNVLPLSSSPVRDHQTDRADRGYHHTGIGGLEKTVDHGIGVEDCTSTTTTTGSVHKHWKKARWEAYQSTALQTCNNCNSDSNSSNSDSSSSNSDSSDGNNSDSGSEGGLNSSGNSYGNSNNDINNKDSNYSSSRSNRFSNSYSNRKSHRDSESASSCTSSQLSVVGSNSWSPPIQHVVERMTLDLTGYHPPLSTAQVDNAFLSKNIVERRIMWNELFSPQLYYVLIPQSSSEN